MPFTNEIDPYASFKMLFVGDNGTGKTGAAASFYKHKKGRILIDDFDGRMKSIKKLMPDAKIEYNTILSQDFKRFQERIEGYQDQCDLDVWILDSVTSASMTCVVHQLQTKGVLKNKAGLPVTSWDEINGETVMFTKLLEITCKTMNEKFGTSIIWCAHPVNKGAMNDTGAMIRAASIVAYGPKVASLVPNMFDEIYNFTVERAGLDGQTRRFVNTVQVEDLPGKTALNLPAKMNITDKLFYDVFMESLKSASSK